MIRNIAFDMGGVLIHFTPEEYVRRLGVGPEDEKQLLWQVFRSLEWAQMDRGSLTDEQAWESICTRLPQRLHEAARELVMEWDRPVCAVEGMYELAGDLKAAGYKLYLLSNASLRHPAYWREIPVSRFFDGVLVSSSVGLVKPQPEIYRLLCGRFGLNAEECFFVDDLPGNVEGAYYCGMRGAVFHGDVAELRQRLRESGVQAGCGPYRQVPFVNRESDHGKQGGGEKRMDEKKMDKNRCRLVLNGFPVRNLAEIRMYFSAGEVLSYQADGSLAAWLWERGYEKEAAAVREIGAALPEEELLRKLADVLGLEITDGAIRHALTVLHGHEHLSADLWAVSGDGTVPSSGGSGCGGYGLHLI